jgi:hypothetical protein
MGLLYVAEGDISLQPPRPVLRRVWDFTGVMLFEPRSEIVGDADVKVLGIETFEEINVFHRAHPIQTRLLERENEKRED